jgi:hypothetical protein
LIKKLNSFVENLPEELQVLCQVNKTHLYQLLKIFFAFSITSTDYLLHHIGAHAPAWFHIGACLNAIFDLQWSPREKSEFQDHE